MSMVGMLLVVIWMLFMLGGAVITVAAPVYLAIELGRGVRALARRRASLGREQARAQAVLREQYASGMLTLVGLEERLGETFRASSHLELEHVLDDLPRRPAPLPGAAQVEVVAALALLLVLHSPPAKAIALALGVAAVVPRLRGRAVLYGFLAGLAVVASPLAAAPVALCAAWRMRETRF
jgi:hypothetical protein